MFRPGAMGSTVLHRLGELGIHWHHLFQRAVNVHVIIFHRRRRRRGFGSRNHRFWGGLVSTSSSRMGGRRGRSPGGFAPGMMSETACGLLLLLLEVVAVTRAMNSFPALPGCLWGQAFCL